MKVEELQIGDWVAIGEPDNFHGYTGKVVNINGNTNYVTVFIPCHHDHDVLVDDLSPIPLTLQWLSKFCIYESTKGSGFFHLGNNFFLFGNMADAFTICIKTYDGYSYEYPEIVYCESVHELQHAIRLLNIDKEIII